MPDPLYWIILGFLAGALSGAVVGGRTARGCLPNIVVGVLGAIVGGWLATQLGFTQGVGFLAALIVAVIGAIVVRVILEALSPNDRR
ncbi:MAG TPA: GlsB/YeaQ/YmgE family stress response membrane protein [Candidatus Limnocylindrales bacterium]|nr:GlsB/YeaQ/YmgE family stress response membrane protein [Candidatus Limnocylindrales bacterium]